MWVWVPSAAGTFLSGSASSADSLVRCLYTVQSLCAVACINICAHIKNNTGTHIIVLMHENTMYTLIGFLGISSTAHVWLLCFTEIRRPQFPARDKKVLKKKKKELKIKNHKKISLYPWVLLFRVKGSDCLTQKWLISTYYTSHENTEQRLKGFWMQRPASATLAKRIHLHLSPFNCFFLSLWKRSLPWKFSCFVLSH